MQATLNHGAQCDLIREENESASAQGDNQLAELSMGGIELQEDVVRHLLNVIAREHSVATSEQLSATCKSMRWLSIQDDKVVVFSYFNDMLDLIERMLRKRLGLNSGQPRLSHSSWNTCGDWVRVDGKLGPSVRQQLVNQFNDSRGPRLFLVNYQVGAEGLNLQAGNVVVLMDPWFNPAKEDQAIARCHRCGQYRTVSAFCVSVKGTVEKRVQNVANDKRRQAARELGDESSEGAWTRAEAQYLIMGDAEDYDLEDAEEAAEREARAESEARAEEARAEEARLLREVAEARAQAEARLLQACGEGISKLCHAIEEAYRVGIEESKIFTAQEALQTLIRCAAQEQPSLESAQDQTTGIISCFRGNWFKREMRYHALHTIVLLGERHSALLADMTDECWATLRELATKEARRTVKDQLAREILRAFNKALYLRNSVGTIKVMRWSNSELVWKHELDLMPCFSSTSLLYFLELKFETPPAGFEMPPAYNIHYECRDPGKCEWFAETYGRTLGRTLARLDDGRVVQLVSFQKAAGAAASASASTGYLLFRVSHRPSVSHVLDVSSASVSISASLD
eukprot:7349820-Prymnesium_polylepis.1